jgi:hypothetical protein
MKGEWQFLQLFLFGNFSKQLLKLSMRKHSAFFNGPEAIWGFAPNWNDLAEFEGEFWCSTVGLFSPGIRRASSKLAPTETRGIAGPGFGTC